MKGSSIGSHGEQGWTCFQKGSSLPIRRSATIGFRRNSWRLCASVSKTERCLSRPPDLQWLHLGEVWRLPWCERIDTKSKPPNRLVVFLSFLCAVFLVELISYLGEESDPSLRPTVGPRAKKTAVNEAIGSSTKQLGVDVSCSSRSSDSRGHQTQRESFLSSEAWTWSGGTSHFGSLGLGGCGS